MAPSIHTMKPVVDPFESNPCEVPSIVTPNMGGENSAGPTSPDPGRGVERTNLSGSGSSMAWCSGTDATNVSSSYTA